MIVLSRLNCGERPSPAEFFALDIESGIDPREARGHADRYAKALDAIGSTAQHTGEHQIVETLRAFRLRE